MMRTILLAAAVAVAGEYIFGGSNLTAEPCGMTLQANVVDGAPGFHNVDLADECVGHAFRLGGA